MRDIKLG